MRGVVQPAAAARGFDGALAARRVRPVIGGRRAQRREDHVGLLPEGPAKRIGAEAPRLLARSNKSIISELTHH